MQVLACSNADISPGLNSTRLKTVRSALWRCPSLTVALRLLENVVKVTNQEVVKIEFRHLPILLSSSPASLGESQTAYPALISHGQLDGASRLELEL